MLSADDLTGDEGVGNSSITNNRIISNTNGLAIHNSGTLFILDNYIAHNTNIANRSRRGGGMVITGGLGQRSAKTLISGNDFIGNVRGLGAGGGALYIASSRIVTVTDNLFLNNTAPTGGGIRHRGSGDFAVERNTFQGNHATQPNGGGAVVIENYSDEERYSFTDNEFIGNTATAPDDPDTPPTQRVPHNLFNWVDSSSEPFNARGNFWGTDDRAEIQARIYDGSDDTSWAFVDFEDFRLERITNQQPLTPGQPNTQQSADGMVQMTIPGAAITEPTTITHRILTRPTVDLPTGSMARYSFSTGARIADGASLSRFAAPITLVIDVPAVLAQTGETGLNVAYRDGATWTNLLPCEGCSVTDSQVTVVTDRLGEFALVDVSDTGDPGGGDNQLYLPLVRRE